MPPPRPRWFLQSAASLPLPRRRLPRRPLIAASLHCPCATPGGWLAYGPGTNDCAQADRDSAASATFFAGWSADYQGTISHALQACVGSLPYIIQPRGCPGAGGAGQFGVCHNDASAHFALTTASDRLLRSEATSGQTLGKLPQFMQRKSRFGSKS